MTEQQEKIQNILDEFILKNDADLERVSTENPLLLKSVLDVVDVLSKKFGTGKTTEVSKPEPVEEKSEEVIIKADREPLQKAETKVETVSEIKKEQEEQLSAEDIKAAIKNLKPLAEFDEDVQKEIDRLKQQLKTLKSKKS